MLTYVLQVYELSNDKLKPNQNDRLRDFLANLPLISIYVLYCVKEVCILISDKKSFCAVPRAQLDKRYQNVPRCPPDRDLSSEQRYPPFKQTGPNFFQ